jgi:hypothetical protein
MRRENVIPLDKQLKCRVIGANPPKEMGDWMPLPSPTCKIRSNAGGNGLHKERKIKNNPCSKLVPVTQSNWSGNSQVGDSCGGRTDVCLCSLWT